MKAIFIAGLGAALVASSTYAQQTQMVGQPVLRAPAPMVPEVDFGQPAKLPRAARAPSTPELRSAAALALSADPVFDEGTYQRIKETLLSYAAIQVRGGWPASSEISERVLSCARDGGPVHQGVGSAFLPGG